MHHLILLLGYLFPSVPKVGVRFAHNVGLLDDYRHQCGERRKGHGHAVVVVGGYVRQRVGGAACAVPCKGVGAGRKHKTAFAQFGGKGGYAVGLFDAQGVQTAEREGDAQSTTQHGKGLRHVGYVAEVVGKMRR